MNIIMSFSKRNNFTFSVMIHLYFMPFSCLKLWLAFLPKTLASISETTMSKRGEREPSFWAPDLSGNASSFVSIQ